VKYDRNVVALGEMEQKTAELSESAGRVFGCRVMGPRATVEGILSDGMSIRLLPLFLSPSLNPSHPGREELIMWKIF